MPLEIIRDPLWNNIRLDPLALELVDTATFQRLRYVRQLGLAYLVYPGASHSRFEHALGAYHLAGRALTLLEERDSLSESERSGCQDIRIAALLHDIGHYPFSHALEEIGALHHEEVGRSLVMSGEIARILAERMDPDAPRRITQLIRGESDSPLARLISGSLDLDKIEYLKRDAFMCGVSYGDIDADRLLNSLVLVDDPAVGHRSVGIAEKGLSALESLLFAKYQMYRNVYWHHAVRSATAMYKRLVSDALSSGALRAEQLPAFTDEGILHALAQHADANLLAALRERRLYKRAFECPAAELPTDAGEWIADDHALCRQAEDALALSLGMEPGSLLLDYPAKTQMLGLDMPVLRRGGRVERLTGEGRAGAINLPRLSEEFYRSARWLRVFTRERVEIPGEVVMRIATMSVEQVRAFIAS